MIQFIFFVSLALLITSPLHSAPIVSASRETFDADLERVRERVINDLLAPAVDRAEIKKLLQTREGNGTWPDINYEDVSRTGFQHSQHLTHMLVLARAYKKPGSSYFHDAKVKKAVASALDFWLEHDFISDNWWWNEMGAPSEMINLLLILDDSLTEKQRQEGLKIAGRANMVGVGARPGGDLIQIAGMMGKQALFKRDEAFLKKVLKIMADEVKITTGRGLKPDMSFHHRIDKVISTLSYGSGYIGSFAYWIVKIQDTHYTLPGEALPLLIDYFLDGICQSMVYGKYPDPGAMNRGMTRKGALTPSGPGLAEDLLQASSYRKEELEEIIKIRKGEIVSHLTKTRFFWHSEYFTLQRPKYFASVRMHSSRNHTMEEPHNDEGLKMHHFGDGSNFISLTGREYFNIYPVWDWQKIPGTTVVQKPKLPHWNEISKKGLTDFVGGISDGTYGAAAFDFESAHDPLKGRKSWFFFDNEYVSLGAGIQSKAAYPVNTTLNQTRLNSTVVVGRSGTQEVLTKGEHDLGATSWVLHDKVAYLFPTPTSVHLTNKTATGNWRQINHQGWATNEEVKEEVFTLWLDHGIQPKEAAYAYIVIPNMEAASIPEYQQKSAISILSNTPEIQAVQHSGLGQSQLVFYQAGKIQVNAKLWVEVDQPCMLMIVAKGNKIRELVVSDPSRKLKVLNISSTGKTKGAGEQWTSTWDSTNKKSRIQVTLPQDGYAGQSVVLLNKK